MDIITKDNFKEIRNSLNKNFEGMVESKLNLSNARFTNLDFTISASGFFKSVPEEDRKQKIREVRIIIERRIAKSSQELGIDFKLASIKYEKDICDKNRYNFKTKINGVIANRHEEAVNSDLSHITGTNRDWYGKIFKHEGTRYTITGVNLRASKYQVEAESQWHKKVRFMAVTVEKMLAIAEHANRISS